MAHDLDGKRMPWLRMGLDMEGVAAALGALLVGLLLGWLWSPLFWIGFLAAVVAIFAARWAHRTAPDLPTGIVAPCDGIVVSVSRADAPTELRLIDEATTRIRIATAPFATNKLYAPIAGSVETLILEVGEQSTPIASAPDEHGLAAAYLTLTSQGQEVGFRVSTGGLGPRLELTVEDGDSVRLGRSVGTRRLGGWCDVYVPASAGTLIWPGQSLVGGETVLGRLKVKADTHLFDGVVEEDAYEVPNLDEIGGSDETPTAEPEIEDAAAVSDDEGEWVGPDTDDTPKEPTDPAEMFARLKKAAKEIDRD